MPVEINCLLVDRVHLARLQPDGAVATEEWTARAYGQGNRGLWQAIEDNHRSNCRLWLDEDRARRTDVDDSEIARCKRRIDRCNQARNDAVERIDVALSDAYAGVPRHPDARQHSETPGAMIDRLSILRLKIHHMALQARRRAAGSAHMANCGAKLERLREQHADLCRCFDMLLAECRRGQAYFKLYRQFKMYNDPTLNPWLYGAPPAAQADAH